MLTLQWNASNHAELDCADAKSGHELQETAVVHARALEEIALAVRLAKAVYGLGRSPRSLWFSVDRFSTWMGGRRTGTDPTVWCFSTEGLRTTNALVAAYVNDLHHWHTWTEILHNSSMRFVNDSVGFMDSTRVLVCVVFESIRKWTIRLFLTKRLMRTKESIPSMSKAHTHTQTP